MKIQPVLMGYSPNIVNRQQKKAPSFEGSWDASKLNILSRDDRAMRELGKSMWALSDDSLRDASVVKNFCGVPSLKLSMEAYGKLRGAVEPFRAQAAKVKDRLIELSEKEKALNERAIETVLNNCKSYITTKFVVPFVNMEIPSPSLLISDSNQDVSSDRLVYWAIKQAESLSENICYKAISGDVSKENLMDTLESANHAQEAYGDLTLFDITMKVKGAKNSDDEKEILDFIKTASGMSGVAVIAGVPKDNSLSESLKNTFAYNTSLFTEKACLSPEEEAEFCSLKSIQKKYVEDLKNGVSQYHSSANSIIQKASEDIMGWGKPKFKPENKILIDNKYSY